MRTTYVAKFTAIALHGILLSFSVAVAWDATGGQPAAAFASKSDPALTQALMLIVLVMSGNAIGIVATAYFLLKGFIHACFVSIYEAALFIISLQFLSIDFSIVFGLILASAIYCAYAQRQRKLPSD